MTKQYKQIPIPITKATTPDFAQFLNDFEQQCKCYPNYNADSPAMPRPVRRDPLSPMWIALKNARLI